MITQKTRLLEEKRARLFCEKKPFSAHLFKWEDAALPDKYHHNCFEYTAQPTQEEYLLALEYQKKRGDTFIVLEGDAPLEDDFGLECGVTLTMVLRGDCKAWKQNPDIRFAAPSLAELEEIEVKHFASLYGEDFTRRNARRMYEKLQYHGAYVGNTLVGACYSFCADGLVCIDGLIVDEAHRHQYIATALIAHVVQQYANCTVMLHADADDTPREMYLKMGFEIADCLYDYSCTDLNRP